MSVEFTEKELRLLRALVEEENGVLKRIVRTYGRFDEAYQTTVTLLEKLAAAMLQ